MCENLTLLHEKEIHKDRCTEIDMYKISLWKDILKSYGHQSANINKTNNQQSKTQEKWRWKSRFKERQEICGEVKPINWVTSLQLYGDNQTRLNFHLLHHPYLIIAWVQNVRLIWFWTLVFSTTFSNISAISWRPKCSREKTIQYNLHRDKWKTQ